MSLLTRRGLLAAGIALSALVAGSPAVAAGKEVTIAYQTGIDPAKLAQAEGAYEKATGWKINWRKFDSGADVITAIASGDVQIGYVGSSPLAAAASRELPVETIFVAALLGDAEAFVVRNGAGIKEPKDLAGKKIGVPFVSTTHYSLLAALKHWGVDAKSVTILNLRPPELAAAFERGDIDGGYVWDPALGRLKANGTVLTSSAQVATWGAPTFDAWIARADFGKANPEFVAGFVKVTGDAYKAYRDNPGAWTADSARAKAVAALTGSKAEDVPGLLKDNTWPLLAEQAGPALLGGGIAAALADTAAFLKEQQRIPTVLGSYAPYVNKAYAEKAAARAVTQ